MTSADHHRPLLLCDDGSRLEQLLRVCAAAGCEPVVLPDPASAAAAVAWNGASVVVVSSDLAAATCAAVAGGGLLRRPAVVVVGIEDDDSRVWRWGVQVGASHVVVVPAGEGELVELLRLAMDGPGADGRVIAVAGGRGGAGATTLAAAVALAGLRRGLRTMLVDADPLGGGIDLAVGAELAGGLRWPALTGLRGRLPGAGLGEALPRVGEMTVLSFDRDEHLEVPAEAMAALLDAGTRGSDLVVVDVPRNPDPAARVVLSRALPTFLVVPAEVRACASAARTLVSLAPQAQDVRLVVRVPGPARLAPDQVAAALGLPLALTLRSEPAVAQALERGEPPGRLRGALARGADQLLAAVLAGPAQQPAA